MNTDHFRGRRVHLMGIGGAGMSALVPLLIEAGAQVDGCDLHLGSMTKKLGAQGIGVKQGHDVSHVCDCDLLVHTSAVQPNHAEIQAAKAKGAEIMPRPLCLALLMRGTRTLAVAGSHGKTSTTWMLGHLLSEVGADPLVMVGGAVDRLGQQGSRIGKSEVFVAEVDESDGGFELVEPNLAIVTNLDAEHLRHYGSFESLCAAFRRWLGRLGPQGTAIVPVRGLPEQVTRNLDCTILRCGLGEGEVSAVDIEAGSEGSSFRVIWLGQDLGRISIRIPGIHMILNALMAIAAARATLPDCPIQTLATCERVGRRFTVHGTPRGIRVVEDYGHHPTEVQATIAAARLAGGPVHVAFQPHRYTRTQDCFDAFCQCFDQAASLVLLPVYAASETPIPGASSEALAAAIRARRQANGLGPASCDLATKDDDATDLLCQRAQRGDTVLILGAGDIGRMAPRLTAALDGRRRTQE